MYRVSRVAVVLGVILGASAPPLRAQEPTSASAVEPGDSATPKYTPLAEALGFIDILPSRDQARIQADLEPAKADELEADASIAQSADLATRTKEMIEAKKREISTIQARLKLASKNKQEADKASFEAEKKVAERQKEFLERRAALHEAEIDEAKAAKKLAVATQRALDLELELATRRAGRAGVAGLDAAATLSADAVIRELERKTLEAQKSRAESASDLADRDQDIAKRRLELYQAQTAAAGVR